ncbi:hypothetical protein ICY20_20685 [Pseudomonas sp. P115]|uniref:calcium-binding protein n=1 Tax=Pseudomonas pisciculturae TaxID=2730413 RepID=UPI0018921FEA|nr:calcium-binding protein [Pseudomonas pisciculturae]MBF6030175.1 hypothetical protein [Pseudomonas pisciculturae]
MSIAGQYELEIGQITAQGFKVIQGAGTAPGPVPPVIQGSVEVLLHSSNQLTIARRVSTDADQLIFTTLNHDDIVVLRKYVPEAAKIHAIPLSRSHTALPLTTLTLEVNDEKYCIIPATRHQVLVFITQGGSDVVQIDDRIENPVMVDSGDGDDFVISAATSAKIVTGAGNDSVTVFKGANHIDAGPGDDLIQAKFDADITAYGGPGNDEIAGGRHSFIDGGNDNDLIIGGHGHSILIGGPGDDDIEAGDTTNVIITGDAKDKVTLLKPDDIMLHNYQTAPVTKLPT